MDNHDKFLILKRRGNQLQVGRICNDEHQTNLSMVHTNHILESLIRSVKNTRLVASQNITESLLILQQVCTSVSMFKLLGTFFYGQESDPMVLGI